MNWIYLLIAPAIFCLVMGIYNVIEYRAFERKRKRILAQMDDNNRRLLEAFRRGGVR